MFSTSVGRIIPEQERIDKYAIIKEKPWEW
jgi:hypothetical protein